MNAGVMAQGACLALSLLPVALFVRHRWQNRVHKAYAVVMAFGFLWALGQYAENCLLIYTQNEAAYRAALYVTYAGICGIGPSTVYMAWCYSGQYTRYGNRRLVAALFGAGLFFWVCVVTSRWHPLYYRAFSMAGKQYGPLFYVFVVATHACLCYAFYAIQHVRWGKQRTTWLALVCMGPPVLANMLGMLCYNPMYDVTTLCYLTLALGTHWFVRQYRPTNLAPIAAKSILDHLGYPLVIHSGEGDIVYENIRAQRPRPEGRVYRTRVKLAEDGHLIVAKIDMTEREASLAALAAQQHALAQLTATLAQQTQTLIDHAQSASQLAAEQRRVDIMSRLNEEICTLLEELATGTQRALDEPTQAQIEQNIALTVAGMETVRRIINENRSKTLRHL